MTHKKIMVGFCIVLAILGISSGLSGCGKQGAPGSQGVQGIPGSNCTVTLLAVGSPGASNGGSLIQCPDGSSSLVLNGNNGENGQAGTPGTVVTPIQFCTGYTTTYPSSFPEFGVCINNLIYAVYWDGSNAWLAQIVPGYYASTSTNAACDFTVAENCTITH
jgi:hypothetical protein